MTRIRKLLVMTSFAATLWPFAMAQAAWPERPVHFLVSGPSGGVLDIIARVIGKEVTAPLGQAVVVDDRPGAAGNIGAATVAHSKPDGQTILFTSNAPLAQNRYLYTKRMPFNPVKDLVPIAVVAETPLLFVVRADSPVHNLKELVEYSKKKSGGLMFGSIGNGSLGHLIGLSLAHQASAHITHVPYNGGPPAQLALLSGQVDFCVDTIGQYAEQIKAGKIRAIAVTAKQGTTVAGQAVQSVGDEGYPNLLASIWIAAAAPAGTPPEVITRMNDEINQALKKPEVKQALATLSFEPVGGTPAELSTRMSDATNAVWKDLIQRYSISLN